MSQAKRKSRINASADWNGEQKKLESIEKLLYVIKIYLHVLSLLRYYHSVKQRKHHPSHQRLLFKKHPSKTRPDTFTDTSRLLHCQRKKQAIDWLLLIQRGGWIDWIEEWIGELCMSGLAGVLGLWCLTLLVPLLCLIGWRCQSHCFVLWFSGSS